MDIDKTIDSEVICAITAALGLYTEQQGQVDVMPPPPYIILPSVLSSPQSPWRFVGRNEAMENRTMVFMKSMRW